MLVIGENGTQAAKAGSFGKRIFSLPTRITKGSP